MTLSGAVFIPSFPNKELHKIDLAFEREWRREVSVSICLTGTPGHLWYSAQRTSASVDQLGQLTWSAAPMSGHFFSWRDFIQQHALEVHSFSAEMGVQEETLLFSFSEGAIIMRARTCLAKEMLLSAILDVVKLRVLVYSRIHLEFCQIRKGFCLLAYFAWRVLHLHYVRWCTRCRSVLTDLNLIHYPWHIAEELIWRPRVQSTPKIEANVLIFFLCSIFTDIIIAGVLRIPLSIFKQSSPLCPLFNTQSILMLASLTHQGLIEGYSVGMIASFFQRLQNTSKCRNP